MKRFVVVSDLHIHPWSMFATGDGIHNSRMIQTLSILDSSLRLAQSENIPWLFAGDLINTAGHSLHVVMARIMAVFEQYPDVEKVAVWGNHDARGVGGQIELDETVYGTFLTALQQFIVLDPSFTESIKLANGLTVVGAGYQPKPEWVWHADMSADVGLFHQTVKGSVTATGFELTEGVGRSGRTERLDPAWLLAHFRISVVGHVHHPQQITAPKGQAILIPGSPEHHTFGDRGEHGWWVVELPEAPSDGVAPAPYHYALNPEVHFIPGGSSMFLTVETPDLIKKDGNYYRVRRVPPGTEVPEGVDVIAPSPTIVTDRDLLYDAAGTEQILQTWIHHHPIDIPRDEDRDYPEEVFSVGRDLLQSQDPIQLRDVRLVSLELTDFCSFEHETIQIQDGLWLITGTGKDYPSNGAGKSTVLGEALHWLLFGRTTKGMGADEVIRWGQASATVTGVFVDPQGYELTVTRSKGFQKSILRVTEARAYQTHSTWEASSVNEMTTKLNRWLGITPAIFQSLAYFSQENVLLFSSATDGDRKNVLGDLIGLSAYQKACTEANEHLTELNHGADAIQLQIGVLGEDIKRSTSLLIQTQVDHDRWDGVHNLEVRAADEGVRIAEQPILASQHIDLSLQYEDQMITELVEQQKKHEQQVGKRTGLITADWGTIAHAQRAVETLDSTQTLLHQAFLDYTEADRVMGVLDGLLQGSAEIIEAASTNFVTSQEALKRGECPLCFQEITTHHRDECTATGKAQLTELETEHKKKQQELVVHKEALDTRGKQVNKIRSSVRVLEQTTQTLQAWEQAKNSLEDVILQQKNLADWARNKAREQLESERFFEITTAKGKLEQLKAHENPHTVLLQRTKEQLAEQEGRLANIKEQRKTTLASAAIYEYWRFGFSKQGLQSLLVEEIAALFNKYRGDVFPLLTQGIYDVQFSAVSTTRAGDIRERTQFFITERGKPIPYSALSGGQRRRIDIGIMLVLAQVVAQWMGTRGVLGLLILDEVVSFLDASGAEGLLLALQQICEHIPTTFVITHDLHLQSLFPNVIHVTQSEDGISRVDH